MYGNEGIRPTIDGTIKWRRTEDFEVQQVMQPANIADQDGMEASVPQWDQARIELISTWNEIQEKEQRMIQAGFINKVDPWLERTGWHRYLAGLDRHQLLHSIAKRDPDE